MSSTSSTISTWGLDGAELLRRVEQLGLCDAGVGASVLPNDGRAVRLRLQTDDAGRLAWADAVVRAQLGNLVIGAATLEDAVVQLLGQQDLTVACAESLTTGLIATRLSEPPNASDVFQGGVVSYASRVKFAVLGVPEGAVVTAEAAAAMAHGACRVIGADCAVAATGVAGPTEMEGKPVGTVYVGSCVDGLCRGVLAPCVGDRDEIRKMAASAALNELRLRLLARARGTEIGPTTTPSPGACVEVDLTDHALDPA